MRQQLLDIPVSDRMLVAAMSVEDITNRAIRLLRSFEPPDGYYLAFSAGKDSCACKKLCQMAGVKYEAWYNNTTIDPPELIWFLKREHPDVKWNNPKRGNMLHRIATAPKVPPTRKGRWCCEEYKEGGGAGRVKVFGVRAEESKRRAGRWLELARDRNGDAVVCPIVYWSTEQLWGFIRSNSVPYCSLYDEGFSRLGCVGCPLADKKRQDIEFLRWPRFEAAWKRAVIDNWTCWHDIPNTKTGEPRFHAKFASGEEFWQWWRNYRKANGASCQKEFLWTNE